MRDNELIPEVDFSVIKKILSSDKLCQKLLNYEDNKSDFDALYTKDEYLVSIDCYVYEIVKKMSKSFNAQYLPILSRYFNYFVKNRYNSFLEYFSNPVVNNIHLIKNGNYSQEELKFLSDRNSSGYLVMLDCLKKYYENIINNENYNIDYDTLYDIFIFFSSGKLDYMEIKKKHCDYIFSKLLDSEFINKSFPKSGFEFYFKRFTEIVAKDNKLSCACEMEHIPANSGKVSRAYYIPPYNKIIINKDFLYDNMEKNLSFFTTIFHELSHCHFFTKRKISYFMLKMTKDMVLREFLGDTYYNDNYRILSVENDAEIRAYIDSLRYFKQINLEYYNSILSSTIKDILNKVNDTKTNIRYSDNQPYYLDQLFEETLTAEQKQFFIKKYPILEFEYYEDGKRKLPIDLLIGRYHLLRNDSNLNEDSIKMCSALLINQMLSVNEILETYSNSSILLDTLDLDFENQRLKLLGDLLVKKLELGLYSLNNDNAKKIQIKIISVFMDNILMINSSFNNNLDKDKINYLNLRLKNDVYILENIIKKFKRFNKNRNIDLDFENLKENNEKKGLL